MCQHWFLQTIHFDNSVSPHPRIKLNNEHAFPEWFSYSLYPSLALPFLDMLQVASQTHFWSRKQVDWFGSSCKFFFFICGRTCYDFEQCFWVKPVLVFSTEWNSIVNSRGLGSKRSQRSSQVWVRWASQRVPLWSGIVLESLRTSCQVDQTKF
jgi:hypothetical protein